MTQDTTTALQQAVAPQTTSKAVTTTKKATMLDVLRGDAFQNQMKCALPKALTAERLTRIVITEVRKTPDLALCTQDSFLGAVMQAAQLGIEPGSALGHAYLIPFNRKTKEGKYQKECQLIIGYKGMLDLARRSGQIKSIQAYCVYEKDDFHYELGTTPGIHHIPSSDADRGSVTHVYAVAQLKDGGLQFEVMSRAEIEFIRSGSKGKDSTPWASHWDEMARKTVIRRMFKYLPVSIELATAIEVDEKADRAETIKTSDVLDIDAETGEILNPNEEIPQ